MTRATSTPITIRMSGALRSGIASPAAAMLRGVADRLDQGTRRPAGGENGLPASVALELGAAEVRVPAPQAPATARADWTDMNGLPGERA